MSFDPAALSPVAALFGALVGGCASLMAAIHTQRRGERLQRIAWEITKREAVYADFAMTASNLLLKAHTSDELALTGDEQRLVGLINRMRIFAPPDVIGTAEVVLKVILEILLKPSIQLRELAREALSSGPAPDPLLTFSLVCRRDLESVRETTV